jgi:hypothetical protein
MRKKRARLKYKKQSLTQCPRKLKTSKSRKLLKKIVLPLIMTSSKKMKNPILPANKSHYLSHKNFLLKRQTSRPTTKKCQAKNHQINNGVPF